MLKSLHRMAAVLLAIALSADPLLAHISSPISGDHRSSHSIAAIQSQALAPNPTTGRLLLRHSHAFIAAILVSAGLVLHPAAPYAFAVIGHPVLQSSISTGWLLLDAVMLSIFAPALLGVLRGSEDSIATLDIDGDSKHILREHKIRTREDLRQLTPGDVISMPRMTRHRLYEIEQALRKDKQTLRPDSRPGHPELLGIDHGDWDIDLLKLSDRSKNALLGIEINQIDQLRKETEYYLRHYLHFGPNMMREIKRRLWDTGRWTLNEVNHDYKKPWFPPIPVILLAAGAAALAALGMNHFDVPRGVLTAVVSWLMAFSLPAARPRSHLTEYSA